MRRDILIISPLGSRAGFDHAGISFKSQFRKLHRTNWSWVWSISSTSYSLDSKSQAPLMSSLCQVIESEYCVPHIVIIKRVHLRGVHQRIEQAWILIMKNHICWNAFVSNRAIFSSVRKQFSAEHTHSWDLNLGSLFALWIIGRLRFITSIGIAEGCGNLAYGFGRSSGPRDCRLTLQH